MKIKFIESETAFRTINGRHITDEEWEAILKKRKAEGREPFVRIITRND